MDSQRIFFGEGESISQQTLGQRFSRPNTLGELLSASSPNQTGLLKLLAVAYRQRMPLAPLVRSFSNEVKGSLRFRLKDFANAVESGVDPIEALEKIGRLLTPPTVLALRLARDDKSLPHFYQSVTEYSPEFQRDTGNPGEGVQRAISLWIRFHFVLAVIGFLMLYIVPEFQMMFEEFGLEIPGAMRELMRLADLFAKLWFLWALILIPICYWLGGSIIRQLSPANWRRRRESKDMTRRRSLALAVESRPENAVLPTIYSCGPVKKFFKRLINANARIENGEEYWGALAGDCLLYTSPSPRDRTRSRMPSSA